MNISQPVSSHLQSVSFGHLSDRDIRALSARRITSTLTFDTLLNPVPGGLYTPELGQFGDNECSTCGQKTPQCPGHPGHIELPVPCYHPTFMDQIYKYMNASCVYCGRLRISRLQVSRISGRLRLLHYGLVREAQELDQISIAAAMEADDDEAEEEEAAKDARGRARILAAKGDKTVDHIIREALANGTVNMEKTEAVAIARQAVIREFMLMITKPRKCANCEGINHVYRKDRFIKIFRKPLKEKDRLAMIQKGMKAKDPLVLQRRDDIRASKGRKRKRDDDEGIADMGSSSDEGVEESDPDDSDEEPEIAGASMVDDAAGHSTGSKQKKASGVEEYLNASRVHAQLVQLFEREQEVLSLIYGSSSEGKRKPTVSPDMFFVRSLLIPPNRYRPENKTSDGGIAEAQENTLYKNILTFCETMADIEQELLGKAPENTYTYPRQRTYVDLENTWVQLQEAVNSLMDKDRNPVQGLAGSRNPDGIKQKLEKKEGMFRKYMMGKRVNFAARTVISPDPNIETNEIGVPPVFAIKLTYPEPVTNWNVEELQEAVKNGPHVWPGAVAIESENGAVIRLDRKNAEERTALANQLLAPSTATSGIGARGTRPKKVHRHLNNGDIVIMNRQPTLHKPSMMCHRARVLPGEKTLRMHYANCNTYNADFDGDEMNMHFPQNELARAEALSIADTDHQYLSGTAGNPLRGLIQDHISMAVWLTNRDTFFERGEYMQLLYAALRPESGHCSTGRIETVPPAIFKPKPLWTGKQVVTSVLKNITPYTHQGLTMTGKSTTDKSLWNKEGAQEQEVVLKDGYLCQGIIDKKQIGPSPGGLVNGLYEAYGHTIAGRALSVLGRLLTRMLQTRAFSCGVEDLVFTKEGERLRQEALAGAATIGLQVAAKYVSLEKEGPNAANRELKRRLEDVLRDDIKQAGLDQLTNSSTKDLSSAVTNACLPYALIKPFPKNQMQAMTSSGAKGSKVNANQISCNLGQQVLEGRRVPVMVSGKTLPCFKPFETSVRAGGYIVDRFLTGVRPQEYYFHAMAGREGLIDTAVKTSRSGYLQRCVIKGMEGLKVEYDTSVRDTTDGSLIQFLYGEDGLDVAKAKYLSDFKFTAENYLSLFHSFGMRDDFERIMSEEAAEYNKKAVKKYNKTGNLGASDPALAVYSPSRYAGSTSETVFQASRDYAERNPDKLIRDKKKGIEGNGLIKKNFQAITDIRYLKSVVEAGEAVGVVAGQSVGEPSTQMTLNTFHLAGHAAKNVTLGIPRLREIVMTAAKVIATPTMTLRCNRGVTPEQARVFAKSISRLSLAEVLDRVTITESVGPGRVHAEAKRYEVRLELFPRADYEREYAVTVEQIAETLERKLLPRLQAVVRKEIKRRGDQRSLKAADEARDSVGQSSGAVEQETSRPGGANREGGDDDSDGEGDDDAGRDKAKRNEMQAGYEAMEDDEEVALQARNQREASFESLDDEAYGGSPRSSAEPDEGERSERKTFADDRETRIRGDPFTKDVAAFSFNDDKRADRCVFSMEYDSSVAKILMLPLVEQAARSSLIQSVPGIGSCMYDEAATKEAQGEAAGIPHLLASGVNIADMWHYTDLLDERFIATNSVHDVLLHYGVEAARASIARELQAVFAGHGISVDPRHLSLIADYMTRDGGYQAFSRIGYRGNVSPFMKMSFETTVGFLKQAILESEVEALKGPSSRIVVGALSAVGTGGFGVHMPVAEAEKSVDRRDGEDVAMGDGEDAVDAADGADAESD